MRLSPLLLTVFLPAAVQAQDVVAPSDPSQQTPTTVVVTAPKADVKKSIDKTTYNTQAMPRAANGTAQDVLQSTPGVSVTAAGDISVQGNPKVTVLINGKPSAEMSGDTRAIALQTMSGSDIASVEVITNPSAAYNANGGAIINIVLKPDRKPGAHATLRGSVSDQGLWTSAVSGDYTRGKLSLHASGGYRHDASLKFRNSDVDWRDPMSGATGENIASSKVFIRRVTANAAVGAEYDLDDTSTLSAEATYHYRHSRPFFDELHQDYDAGILSDIYHRISDGPNEQSDDAVSLSYSRQTPDTLLKASVQHSDTNTLVDKSFRNASIVPVTPDSFARITGKTAHHLDEATLDYARPLNDVAQLSAGLDFQNDVNGIGNYYATLDPLTGAATIDAEATNRYRATAAQAAAYVTGQVTADRWEALAGLRLEMLRMRLDSSNLPNVDGPRYVSLDPSLHVKYTLDAAHSVTLSYRQSLERPDPEDLDPHITYGDAQNISSGNPDLKPQALKSLELGFDDEQKNLSRTFGLFYRRSTETVVDARSFVAGNVLLTSKQNGGNGVSAGATGSVDWKVADAWHLTGDVSVYDVRLETMDLFGPVRQEAVSFQANMAVSYHHGADDVSFDAHVQGPGISPQRWQSGSNTLNLTWQRKLGKRLSLTVNANDLLDGSKQSYRVRTATFTQVGYNHFDVRKVYVGVVYRTP